MAASSEQLSSQADQLKDSVEFFRLDTGTQRGGAGRRASSPGVRPATRPAAAPRAAAVSPPKGSAGMGLDLGDADDADFERR